MSRWPISTKASISRSILSLNLLTTSLVEVPPFWLNSPSNLFSLSIIPGTQSRPGPASSPDQSRIKSLAHFTSVLIFLRNGFSKNIRPIRPPVTIPMVVKSVVTVTGVLSNYFLEPKPYVLDFGFKNCAAGARRPARKAFARLFGSVTPLLYRATTAAAEARTHNSAIAFSFLIFIVLLIRCPPWLIISYYFRFRSGYVVTHINTDMSMAYPTTVFAEPVKTNQAANNPTKVQVCSAKSLSKPLMIFSF